MIKIKKYKPLKVDLFYDNKLVGTINNETEFNRSILDVLRSGEFDKYYWKVSDKNKNLPDWLTSIEEYETKEFRIDKYGILDDWWSELYRDHFRVCLELIREKDKIRKEDELI